MSPRPVVPTQPLTCSLSKAMTLKTSDVLWANGNSSSMAATLTNESSVDQDAQRDAAGWRDAFAWVQDDARNATSTLTGPQDVHGKEVLDAQRVSASGYKGSVSSAVPASATPETATDMVHYPVSAWKAKDSNTTINGLVEAA
ncbi:hypothetical protein MRX96_023767 [Rhipicephalus microplus]